MTRVLIVEDSSTQAQNIAMLIEDGGHEPHVAKDGMEALALIEAIAPDIICTDLEMPRMNGLQLVEAVRKQHPALPVVLMTAHGSEEVAALALRRGAASYVPKTYLDQDLLATLERVLGVTQAARSYEQALDRLGRLRADFVLGNDPGQIAPVVAYQEDVLRQFGFGDPTERIRVAVALQEALRNAIFHGNLELDSELRQDDEQRFHDLAKKRSAEDPYRERSVFLEIAITPDEARYIVRDEGRGFDPSLLPDPDEPANLERTGGRGLLIIRAFMDRVYHNAAGNEITMIKRG